MLQSGLLLISCLVVSISYPTETSFAHHEIQIGYGMFVFMQWGYSAYFCLAEGKLYLDILCELLRLLILDLQSFSSGVFTSYTSPSSYSIFYWGHSYLSSHSI